MSAIFFAMCFESWVPDAFLYLGLAAAIAATPAVCPDGPEQAVAAYPGATGAATFNLRLTL